MIRFLKLLVQFLPVPILLWRLRDLKDQIKSLNNRLEISYKNSYKKQILIEKLEKEKLKNESLKKLLILEKGFINHGIYLDKNQEEFFVIESPSEYFGLGNHIFSYQYDICSRRYLNSMDLIYEIDRIGFNEKGKTLHIIDIRSIESNSNKGIGSKLLEIVESIAIVNKCDYITGELSWVDAKTHKDRLHYFYRKNGYSITYRKNHEQLKKYADILKKIDNYN